MNVHVSYMDTSFLHLLGQTGNNAKISTSMGNRPLITHDQRLESPDSSPVAVTNYSSDDTHVLWPHSQVWITGMLLQTWCTDDDRRRWPIFMFVTAKEFTGRSSDQTNSTIAALGSCWEQPESQLWWCIPVILALEAQEGGGGVWDQCGLYRETWRQKSKGWGTSQW